MEILLKIFVSSANRNISDFTWSGRSLINITNNRGPSTLPWGIPLVTFLGSDNSPFITTCWVLLLRNDLIQWIISPLIPYCFALCISLWWGNLSNAFLESKYTQSIVPPSSIIFVQILNKRSAGGWWQFPQCEINSTSNDFVRNGKSCHTLSGTLWCQFIFSSLTELLLR